MVVDPYASHFELFGLPRSFDVDRALLDSRFRELQRTVHPDRFASATAQERRLSMQQATRINEGYETLRDPLLRGRYLLELEGYDFGDGSGTAGDPAFLAEQMELREALAAVRGSPAPLDSLAAVMERIAADLDALAGELGDCLGSAARDAREQAAEVLVKMQFFRKLENEAHELEADLEDELD